MVYCEARHNIHKKKLAPSLQGQFLIYDYEKYMDFKGYCPGQDDVSRTISLYGNWSMDLYNFIKDFFDYSSSLGKTFIDVGCHIGWFSKLAQSLNCRVIGFEGIYENLLMASVNAPMAELSEVWFSENTPVTDAVYHADLMKIDIEGNEQWALQYFHRSFDSGTIKSAVIEISPVFNDSYPALIKKMRDWGYDVYELNGDKWKGLLNFNQSDLWFSKK